jgi:hypothetical protein
MKKLLSLLLLTSLFTFSSHVITVNLDPSYGDTLIGIDEEELPDY